MARKVFFSFDYEKDAVRVSQIKQIGAVEGQPIVTSNKWEEVKRGGDPAIKKWIDDNLSGKSCLVVLIGQRTSARRWVKYEIEKAWNSGKGVVGIYIHNLKDFSGNQSAQGSNPFVGFNLKNGKNMSNFAKAYNPAGSRSTAVYDYIKNNLEGWIEEAIKLRAQANS
jgi:hypothetical protein